MLDADKTQRALETIERNAKAQSQLIEDVLDVSRIVSGKMRLNVRSVDLSAILEAAIDAIRPAADAKNIEIRRVLDSKSSLISGDSDRLQQILWNLLSNAVKFTPKNGRISIKLERINSHVEIVIADNGAGIEADTLPHVFERFSQADSSSTRTHGGLGLGLAIVRHLVELHGGTVRAASVGKNQGATFTVTFPIIATCSFENSAGEGDRVNPTANQDVAFACPPELQNLKILVVDDEQDSLLFLRFALEKCGSLVTTATSAKEALAAIKNDLPDVLVSDIGMPDEDGYDLIRRVRELSPENGGRIPAVALTAYARVEDRMRALRSGFQMHVPKPVEPAELVAIIASLAGWNKGN
jgi:CheY-like chemotaxis protein/two-component sensor histidine kinase